MNVSIKRVALTLVGLAIYHLPGGHITAKSNSAQQHDVRPRQLRQQAEWWSVSYK